MNIYLESVNVSLDAYYDDTVNYDGVLPIWPLIRQRVKLTEMEDAEQIIMQARYSDGDIMSVTLLPEVMEGMVIDLSVFSALFHTIQEKLTTSQISFSISGSNGLDVQINIPVINLYVPNVMQKLDMLSTDFRDDLSRREPIAHAMDDAFYIDSRLDDDLLNISLSERGGTAALLLQRQQGAPFSPIPDYASAEVRNRITGALYTRKYYPELVEHPCALTFRWLNSTGSYDFISCYDWQMQPTLLQGLDGGKVTKNEITCVFPVTPGNQNALARLAVSPDVICVGLLPVGAQLPVRCSSTTGAKLTANGLVKTLQLKFVY